MLCITLLAFLYDYGIAGIIHVYMLHTGFNYDEAILAQVENIQREVSRYFNGQIVFSVFLSILVLLGKLGGFRPFFCMLFKVSFSLQICNYF